MNRYARHILLVVLLVMLFLFIVPVCEHVTDQNPIYNRLMNDLCSLKLTVFMYLDDYGSQVSKALDKDAAQRLVWEAWKLHGGDGLLILKQQDGKFIDPWGNPLVIKIMRKKKTNASRVDHKNFLVIIYSMGLNQKDENMKGDDVYCR